MATDGASKVLTPEEAPRIRQIQGVATADTGMVAVTERGPVGEAVLCTSFDEWLRIFGGDIANGDGAAGARGFFEEGGQRLYTVRTVHYATPDDAASKTSSKASLELETEATAPSAGSILGANPGPWDLEPGDTLEIAVDGSAPVTVTFDAGPASRESGAGPFALSDGMTLSVSVDGGAEQVVTFHAGHFADIAAASAEEVAAVINGQIRGASAAVTGSGSTVSITSDKRGTSSGVNITGGSANTELGFPTGNAAGTGDVADIDAVTFSEAKTIIESAVGGVVVSNVGGALRITSTTTGVSSSIHVSAASTADDEFGFDNATHTGASGASQPTLLVEGKYDGAYANEIQIRIADALSGDPEAFDLLVLRAGVVAESFTTLTMDPDAERYVETIVNGAEGSALITVMDLGLFGSPAQKRPRTGTSAPLTGGDDGLVGISDADFVGSPAGKTGLYALDLVENLPLLFVPGGATPAIQNAMISYCEVWRKGETVALLDPPAGLSAAQMVEYVERHAALANSSDYAAIYWPRIKVLNPNKAVYGPENEIVVPPSGVIAGVIARGDAEEGGVYKPAAGVEGRGIMRSCLGFETKETLDERKRDLIFPKRINPLTSGDGMPRYIDGARTLKANGNFPYLSERRGVIFIRTSIRRGLQFARHRNNDESLRAEVERSVRAFLLGEMRKGAFRTKNPDTAFFVDFGPGLNPDSAVFAGKLRGRVGLATQKPAEFIIVSFSQDTRALEAEILGS